MAKSINTLKPSVNPIPPSIKPPLHCPLQSASNRPFSPLSPDLTMPAVSVAASAATTPHLLRLLSPPPSPSYTVLHLVPHRPRRGLATLCFVVAPAPGSRPDPEVVVVEEDAAVRSRLEERMTRKRKERSTYLAAAVASSFGFTSMAVAAVYYRFAWQLQGGEVPVTEIVGTFALSVGAAVGMEFWARWAHKALWHASLWHMHESHHRPREGPFELNDVFAIINAVPAIGLMSFGFLHSGFLPGLCFGAGLGITLFGMAYMFVHDGLVHRRFPVGPVADIPYFRRVASAHQIHHTEKFDGVPYGLFLGPMELEEVGGSEELEKEINRRIKGSSRTPS